MSYPGKFMAAVIAIWPTSLRFKFCLKRILELGRSIHSLIFFYEAMLHRIFFLILIYSSNIGMKIYTIYERPDIFTWINYTTIACLVSQLLVCDNQMNYQIVSSFNNLFKVLWEMQIWDLLSLHSPSFYVWMSVCVCARARMHLFLQLFKGAKNIKEKEYSSFAQWCMLNTYSVQ